jgi:hypothetical protein
MNTGSQIYSPWLHNVISNNIEKREPDEIIIVHHFTDRKGTAQYEIERRSKICGITFERIFK